MSVYIEILIYIILKKGLKTLKKKKKIFLKRIKEIS